MDSSNEPKTALRRMLRQSRPGPESQHEQSNSLRRVIGDWLADREARVIGCFAALPGEPELLSLLEQFPEMRWVLPRVVGSELAFHEVRNSRLDPGSFGIREPSASSVVCGVDEIDVMLCPGMAFSRDGVRLGRGKGFYDRALAGARAIRVGVCFREQVLPGLPKEDHDQRMDFLATPDGLISCG